MFGRQAWMHRGHEDYDSNDIGAISEARVLAALVEAGWGVWMPYLCVRRCDLLIENAEGRVFRVQCKTGQILKGAVVFRPASLRAAKEETGWRRISAAYHGEIDYFGVYCPDNGKVYLIPIEDLPNRCGVHLRVESPKNNQRKRVRWASEYEVKSSLTRPTQGDLF